MFKEHKEMRWRSTPVTSLEVLILKLRHLGSTFLACDCCSCCKAVVAVLFSKRCHLPNLLSRTHAARQALRRASCGIMADMDVTSDAVVNESAAEATPASATETTEASTKSSAEEQDLLMRECFAAVQANVDDAGRERIELFATLPEPLEYADYYQVRFGAVTLMRPNPTDSHPLARLSMSLLLWTKFGRKLTLGSTPR